MAPVGEQIALELDPYVAPVNRPGQTIQEAFEAFHAANPWVLRALEELTVDWMRRGHRRIGIGMLTEVIRWQYGRQTTSADGFKINNNFRSRYVRLMIERRPQWADVFALRELQAP